MTRSEHAWKPISETWNLYGPAASGDTPALARLRDDLRRLQEFPALPVDAIELIGHAISQAYQAALENSWCPECGLRGDGMTECGGCKKPFHYDDLDSVSELCPNCQDEGDDP